MFEKQLKELEKISLAVGSCPDMVQGGGGNTSVKLDEELMAVKASGYRLDQVSPTEGFVIVKYKDIKKYYENVDKNLKVDYEKDSVEFAKRSVVKFEGMKELRPSVEAGFHSILKRCVIHSHSVYANLLCCSADGEGLAQRILEDMGFSFIWVPYVNPGFTLTLIIIEQIKRRLDKGAAFPEVILMQNHGLIVTSDDCDECIRIHAKVNDAIKSYFEIHEAYPEIKLEKLGDMLYESKTDYLVRFFKGSSINEEYFRNIVLYPDQLVYLTGNISVNGTDGKLCIDTNEGKLTYKTGYQEARAIEETLLAYLYIIEKINKRGLKLKTMTQDDISFIMNWESERYRKSQLGDQKT